MPPAISEAEAQSRLSGIWRGVGAHTWVPGSARRLAPLGRDDG